MQFENGRSRRSQMLLWTPAERAIFDAMQAVEAMPAHPLLTEAVQMLAQAQDRVADFVELSPGGHSWMLVFGSGEDAPNKSLDEIFHCKRCGMVKHDYRHNGGQRSPNYPNFLMPGKQGWWGPADGEPKCVPVEPPT